MTTIAAIDIETTGFNKQQDHIIEICQIIYDVERKLYIDIYDPIIYPAGLVLSQKTTDLTGITQDLMETFGVSPEWALAGMIDRIGRATDIVAYVAHNGLTFDIPFLKAVAERCHLTLPDLPVVDTRYDLPYPAEIKSRSMSAVCEGLGVVNIGAHRAVFDVIAMIQVLEHFGFEAAFKASKTPLVELLADNPPKGYGFYWKNGVWHRNVREAYKELEITNLEVHGVVVR